MTEAKVNKAKSKPADFPKVKPRLKKIDPLEPLKMEIAAELGLLEQVKTKGWHSLSAREAGRIGGLMTQRQKRRVNNSEIRGDEDKR